jgi:glycosyltransferase involved in cell wall biosynthesis
VLSILVPTYNYDCTQLVRDLHAQAECLAIEYEIIVADDASPISAIKGKNRAINDILHCRFVELPENVGRARIRNRLADEAQGEWLLFMDADAEVISNTFIADYLRHSDADVVCGGLCHAEVLSSPEVSLRYAYEKRADKKRAARYRAKNPFGQFTPFNFMIRRSVFQDIRFDESIVGYGHEDTLFGIMLERRGVAMRHIDNPLRHVGLERNELFLEKTRSALRNLALLEDAMQGYSSLLKLYGVLRGLRLDGCVARWFVRREALLTHRLMSPAPSLPLFFAYKLGYYCSLKR